MRTINTEGVPSPRLIKRNDESTCECEYRFDNVMVRQCQACRNREQYVALQSKQNPYPMQGDSPSVIDEPGCQRGD